MVRTDLIKKAEENERKVLGALTARATLTEIAEKTKLPISTVKRHLDRLF